MRLLISILVFLGAVCNNGDNMVSAKEYNIVVNNAPPYRIIKSRDNEKYFSGFYVDIIREIGLRLNISFKFKEVPFKRALKLMERGVADIMLGPNRTPMRELYMIYLDVELPRERKAFYLVQTAQDIIEYSNLKYLKIGVLNGATYFIPFDSDLSHHKQAFPNYKPAFKLTSKGRLDTVLAPERLGDYLLLQTGLKLKKASYKPEGKPSYIAISRKSDLKSQKTKLEESLLSIRQDGSFKKIIRKYQQ